MKIKSLLILICVVSLLFLIDILVPKIYDKEIILNLRLPRSFSIFIAGYLLASSGFLVQRVTLNSLADPFIIGTSSGAMLGIIISRIFGFYDYSFFYFIIINLCAFITVYISWWFSVYFQKETSILLSGIAVNSFVISMIVLYVIFSREASINFFHLGFGSFSYSQWSSILYSIVSSLIAFIIVIFVWKDIEIISFNQDKALTVGIDIKLTRFLSFLSVSLLSSSAVSLCGIIGFVGLMSPHIASFVFKKNYGIIFLFITAFMGSLLLLISDIFSRFFFYPIEIPPGVITSILGSLFFFYIIVKGK
ncbi:MAG: iron ABC transporter permease [Elusimicrobiales bacterium]|nr:iron ABC transporter permease [Elusimicrobiales bacterium]